MSAESRRQLIDDYKKRPLNAGVFAIRCVPTGRAWVGANPDLRAAQNALFFLLRAGQQRNPSLQVEWRARGEEAFVFDVLEALDVETPAETVADELKSRLRAWAEQEQAEILLR